MSTRTKFKELTQVATQLEELTGMKLGIRTHYGQGVRLIRYLQASSGEADVSPILPASQLLDWMRAYGQGWQDGQPSAYGRHHNPRARRTKRRTGLIRDVRFFREHGGGVVGEATQGALSLARAEREMRRRGWTVEWRDDPDADWSWLDQPGFEKEKVKDHEVYGAVLRDRHGTVLASLWGIFDPDAKYQRVVEAELASEALHGLR